MINCCLQMSAKQKAQKIYREALKKEGLSEDQVSQVFLEKASRRRSLSRSSIYSEMSGGVVGGGRGSVLGGGMHGGGAPIRSATQLSIGGKSRSETVSINAPDFEAALDSLGAIKDLDFL